MFRFAHPEYLWLLLIIPVLIVAHILYTLYKKRQLKTFGDPTLLKELMPNASAIRPHVKFGMMTTALALLLVGIARPQYGTKEETIKRHGIEAMIALDISNSMLAEDVTPSRLERSKQLLSKMMDNMNDDRVGLVVFAGESFTQLPITCDYVSAKMFLQNITPSLIQAQGTAIGDAIKTCMQAFGNEKSTASRAIVLITDGENHEDDAVKMAKEAADKGIQIFVLGVGKPEGSPIPVGQGAFKKDRSGQVVVSRLNEEMCQEIAAAGNGVYVRVDNTNTASRTLQKELNKLATTEITTKVFTEYNEQYQSFVLMALLLLTIDFFVFSRKNKLLTRLNLFKEKK